MQINCNYINFTSRNPIIRRADDIARRVNNAFPRISETNISDFNNIDKFQFLKFNLREKTRQLRNLKSSRFDNANHFLQKALAFFEPIKERKFGNCAESAQMAVLSAKMNGIENAKIAVLRTKSGKKLDHMVCYIDDGKKSYIIDPWLGFADYEQKAFERYTKEYGYHFDLKHLKAKDLKFDFPKDDAYCRFLSKKIPREDLEKLKSIYPKLVVK